MFTGKCDVWADLRNPLPFRNETVDCFYSHHVIEHLPSVKNHMKEVFRCLKPGGVYRVGGPNGDSAIKKFTENDGRWFGDWPDNRTSIGGRFENFVFCRGEHSTILTYSFLEELLTTTGFINITQCKPVTETGYPELFAPCLAKEQEDDFEVPHTLIVEAVKPRKDAP
jgi:predicted SAM-dependent methyltransferase